jgi:hypothetical protein
MEFVEARNLRRRALIGPQVSQPAIPGSTSASNRAAARTAEYVMWLVEIALAAVPFRYELGLSGFSQKNIS